MHVPWIIWDILTLKHLFIIDLIFRFKWTFPIYLESLSGRDFRIVFTGEEWLMNNYRRSEFFPSERPGRWPPRLTAIRKSLFPRGLCLTLSARSRASDREVVGTHLKLEGLWRGLHLTHGPDSLQFHQKWERVRCLIFKAFEGKLN